jgi:enoyl-CoA hydratase
MEFGPNSEIATETRRGILLLVTLNRPHVANAFNTDMAEELLRVFSALALDAGGLRCVVVTGAGDRAFCAGADLKERQGMSVDLWSRQHTIFERMARAILDCPLPTVGAINGAAYAGGCEIALALDFLYAAQNVRFALTETTLGLIPGLGGTQYLSRAIGERRTKELICSGRPFSATEAERWGMVNAVFPAEDLLDQALGIAERIAGNAPIAVRQAKRAIHHGLQMSLADGLAYEIEAYNRTVATEDRVEGVRAFNEGRKPAFRGR